MKIAVTGHRPQKLFGYDLSAIEYKNMLEFMMKFIRENNATNCISGMALGVDTVFAIASIKCAVDLECAIPCKNHSSRWNSKSVEMYNKILSKANKITMVSEEEYKPWLMQRRNEYMVDNCDLLLAIWDGSSGGTGNCVKYANTKNKNVVIVNPKDFSIDK